MTKTVQAAIANLLVMNKDALAALVRLGTDAGNPVKYVQNQADKRLVWSLIDPSGFTQEPRTTAGSLD